MSVIAVLLKVWVVVLIPSPMLTHEIREYYTWRTPSPRPVLPPVNREN
jgi:hypothetical protein